MMGRTSLPPITAAVALATTMAKWNRAVAAVDCAPDDGTDEDTAGGGLSLGPGMAAILENERRALQAANPPAFMGRLQPPLPAPGPTPFERRRLASVGLLPPLDGDATAGPLSHVSRKQSRHTSRMRGAVSS